MIKRGLLLFLILTLILSACGCQLAKEEIAEEGRDRLIGMYITTEHLDLFDWDAFIKDHIGDMMNDAPIDMNAQYNQRKYATFIKEYEQTDIRFDGIEGIALIDYFVYNDGEEFGYHSLITGDEIADRMIRSGDSLGIEGTLYFSPISDSDIVLFMNPVYQTATGEIYLTAGMGHGLAAGSTGESAYWLSESYTHTINGQEQQESFTVKLFLKPKNKSNKVFIKQMSADDAVLSVTQIRPDSIPSSLNKDAGVAYIIIEYHGYNFDGQYEITREFADMNMGFIPCYFTKDNGIATVAQIEMK